jgi:hypothetical protein
LGSAELGQPLGWQVGVSRCGALARDGRAGKYETSLFAGPADRGAVRPVGVSSTVAVR